jgi:hypothetical protein
VFGVRAVRINQHPSASQQIHDMATAALRYRHNEGRASGENTSHRNRKGAGKTGMAANVKWLGQMAPRNTMASVDTSPTADTARGTLIYVSTGRDVQGYDRSADRTLRRSPERSTPTGSS